jgi:hypothetical protein
VYDPVTKVAQPIAGDRPGQQSIKVFMVPVHETQDKSVIAQRVLKGIEIFVGEVVAEVAEMDQYISITFTRVLNS